MKSYALQDIYKADDLKFQTERYETAKETFKVLFGKNPNRVFSAPGRSEIGGNHTDHNCGKVLAAGVSLDVIAMVGEIDDCIISIKSEGYNMDSVNINELDPIADEENTSAALIRGIVKGFVNAGYKVGGFKAYTTSNVLKGSGLSSSAAFEVLICTILNGLFNDGKVQPDEIAKISQYAENVYFGKPSGLMDQTASAFGGFISIDFADSTYFTVDKIDYDFADSGYNLCIVDTKGNHADLTSEYAAIPVEMKSVAEYFGKNYLRSISKEDVLENINKLRRVCGDRAVLRALHFFDDNERVDKEAAALKNGDFDEFLKNIKESGESSFNYLQNIYANSNVKEQGLSIALYMAEDILGDEGACRVHGGGFAGTIQAFVPDSKLIEFKNKMERVFGDGTCYVLNIRPVGGVEVQF